jgi:DNA modification methylase
LSSIHCCDSRDWLETLERESFAACITDPPYELGFMGRKWDSSGIAFQVEFWRKLSQVLQPGAHLVAFGGTRTFHRITVAIEDAGFEIRDCLMWTYGQGFPKSLDVSKAIDKAAGAERPIVGCERMKRMASPKGQPGSGYALQQPQIIHEHTAPGSPEAAEWDGWGTALKPAWEPIILARKPHGERNMHPTVKPLEVMRWLVRLLVPPGGVLLEPFAGSGTTCCACEMEGVDYQACDQDKESVRVARLRAKKAALDKANHEPLLDLLEAGSTCTP